MPVYEKNKNVQSVETEVVLVDIEKFSLLSARDQVIAAVIANGELEKFLALSSGQSAMNVDEVVAGFVTTGDGFYVILQPSLVGYGLVLGLSLRSMLLNASKENKQYLKGIRVGVHRGTLTAFEDITQLFYRRSRMMLRLVFSPTIITCFVRRRRLNHSARLTTTPTTAVISDR